jgi:hypothetical protein
MKSLMKIRKIGILFLIISLSVFMSMYGCGGGGGDGATSGGGVTYVGVATQATIDSSNAENIATGAYQGGAIGGALGLGAVRQEQAEQPIYLNLSLTIEEACRQIDLSASTGVESSGAIINESDTIYGAGGGSARYTIQVNDVTGDFSGTINFNNYTSQATTMTGNFSYSGKVNISAGAMQQFSLSSDSVSVTQGSKSFTADMTFNYTISGIQTAVVMDVVMRDGASSKTYWVNDCDLTVWDRTSYTEFSITGRYYDPDQGYIDIATSTNFKINATATNPYAGVMLLTGRSATKAKLTALSATTYQVEADTNGDGIYEWNSGIKNW